MQTFKAYRTFENDKVVSSRFVDTTLDELDPGEVVVRTKYSTINYKDALSHNGAGRIMRKYPTVAGIDMAGTVESSDRRALEARRQGDRARLRPRRRARRRLQRARARAGRLDRAQAGKHDGVRRDDARHRRLHRGARDPPDAAQRTLARQGPGGGHRRDRRRRLGGHRDPREARLRGACDHRQARGSEVPEGHRREGDRRSPLDRPRRRSGRSTRRRGPAPSTTSAATCSRGCCRRPASAARSPPSGSRPT